MQISIKEFLVQGGIRLQTAKLGRTELEVSTAGLGCGGFSRIGLERGGQAHAAGIVKAAYDAGITFYDTSAAYGTEAALGEGLAGLPRHSYTLSTKFPYRGPGGLNSGRLRHEGLKAPEELERTLDQSLAFLKTDYIDVYHIHAATIDDYPWIKDNLLPEMIKVKEKGKIRYLGVTEMFASDTSHVMLKSALADDIFDVVMTGYNIINPSAAKNVLPVAAKSNVATLCMFAVRSALSNPEKLAASIKKILESGQGGEGLNEHSLDFLVSSGAASSIPEAAYRFCRHAPGISVVLTGTGSAEHLRQNIKALEMPALPDEALKRLEALFGNVDCVSGQ
ncbi:MAG: aldo/keto reductase [Clostridiales bacterium]|jgi:aryl-alcohol dehydrogenase-like predicted oxidoreductase|nr:aldo/keto reductase [Clostridiales bacterium]